MKITSIMAIKTERGQRFFDAKIDSIYVTLKGTITYNMVIKLLYVM